MTKASDFGGESTKSGVMKKKKCFKKLSKFTKSIKIGMFWSEDACLQQAGKSGVRRAL